MCDSCLVGLGAFAAGWLSHSLAGLRLPGSSAWRRAARSAVAGGSVLHQSLCEHLHGNSYGPYWELHGSAATSAMPEDHSYPHTNVPAEALSQLFLRLQPQFLVEVGSFKGGSSLRILSALQLRRSRAGPKPCLVCIDTFLGDAAMWLNKQTTGRSSLLLKEGCPQLYQQFMVNTRKHADVIVPFPIASLCGLRALQYLAADRMIPLVDFLYLDSAHLNGETLLEIREAFHLLRPGGVLLGDDLDWPAVEEDLKAFLREDVERRQSADEELFAGLPGAFFFAAGGYWVLEAQPRQWMLRKPLASAGREALRAQVLRAEMGEKPSDFIPATLEDQKAMALYQQGIGKLENGDTAEGSRLLKMAGKMSPSLAYHFLLQ